MLICNMFMLFVSAFGRSHLHQCLNLHTSNYFRKEELCVHYEHFKYKNYFKPI